MPDPTTTEQTTPTAEDIETAADAVAGARIALDQALEALGREADPAAETTPAEAAVRKYGPEAA